jgi:hypothetical protein
LEPPGTAYRHNPRIGDQNLLGAQIAVLESGQRAFSVGQRSAALKRDVDDAL